MKGATRSNEKAVQALGALAQPTRLAVFRVLMTRAPHALSAAEIAAARRGDFPKSKIPARIGAAGFTVGKPETVYLPKTPKWAGFNYWGSARVA